MIKHDFLALNLGAELSLRQIYQSPTGARRVNFLHHDTPRKRANIAFHRRDMPVKNDIRHTGFHQQMFGIGQFHRIIRPENLFHQEAEARRLMSTERASYASGLSGFVPAPVTISNACVVVPELAPPNGNPMPIPTPTPE